MKINPISFNQNYVSVNNNQNVNHVTKPLKYDSVSFGTEEQRKKDSTFFLYGSNVPIRSFLEMDQDDLLFYTKQYYNMTDDMLRDLARENAGFFTSILDMRMGGDKYQKKTYRTYSIVRYYTDYWRKVYDHVTRSDVVNNADKAEKLVVNKLIKPLSRILADAYIYQCPGTSVNEKFIDIIRTSLPSYVIANGEFDNLDSLFISIVERLQEKVVEDEMPNLLELNVSSDPEYETGFMITPNKLESIKSEFEKNRMLTLINVKGLDKLSGAENMENLKSIEERLGNFSRFCLEEYGIILIITSKDTLDNFSKLRDKYELSGLEFEVGYGVRPCDAAMRLELEQAAEYKGPFEDPSSGSDDEEIMRELWCSNH